MTLHSRLVHDPFDVRPLEGSALALRTLTLELGASVELTKPEHDSLLYVSRGSGLFSAGAESVAIRERSAGLVLAGEDATLSATSELEAILATVGPATDLHAPMGARALTVSLDDGDAQQATGARSFQLLFGPHNGSTRATFFAGFIPPGKAPWHYHLYDEIVWVPEGPGRLHLEGGGGPLGAGAAFRLRPRQVHIVENEGRGEMTILGVFTPAGSPSAAYLTVDVAAEYRFAG